jgi:hypothetical protein
VVQDLHFRVARKLAVPGLIALLVAVLCGRGLHAQAALEATGKSATPVGPEMTPAKAEPESDAMPAGQADGLETFRIARRDALLGMAQWDHTLMGAFEMGARLAGFKFTPMIPPRPVKGTSILEGPVRLSNPRPRISVDSLARTLRADQLQRQGMNLHMDSAYGNFKLTYREIFSGRANSLGGGLGQASAAATYTTPRFGAGGLMDFSAAALMGTGSVNTLMGGGFGNSLIGGNGPGRKEQNAPTVALKLTF